MSPIVKCEPHYPYRREDGKCNNLKNTNWGSSYHCERRLLPPDFADGISAPRVAADGSELPDARLISLFLMPDMNRIDLKRSNLHMIWGQYLVYDTFKTIQLLGNGIDCCNLGTNNLTHEECRTSTMFPQDVNTRAFNQNCFGLVRSQGCNTCSLGLFSQLSEIILIKILI